MGWGLNPLLRCSYSILLPQRVECFPMVRETWVQSQVTTYQRLKKWYLIPTCLTLSNIRSVSRVKWSSPGKGVAPSLHFGVVAIEKGAFWSPSTMVAHFTYLQSLLTKLSLCLFFPEKMIELWKKDGYQTDISHLDLANQEHLVFYTIKSKKQ